MEHINFEINVVLLRKSKVSGSKNIDNPPHIIILKLTEQNVEIATCQLAFLSFLLSYDSKLRSHLQSEIVPIRIQTPNFVIIFE